MRMLVALGNCACSDARRPGTSSESIVSLVKVKAEFTTWRDDPPPTCSNEATGGAIDTKRPPSDGRPPNHSVFTVCVVALLRVAMAALASLPLANAKLTDASGFPGVTTIRTSAARGNWASSDARRPDTSSVPIVSLVKVNAVSTMWRTCSAEATAGVVDTRRPPSDG